MRYMDLLGPHMDLVSGDQNPTVPGGARGETVPP